MMAVLPLDIKTVFPEMTGHIQLRERSSHPELRADVSDGRAVCLEGVVRLDVLADEVHAPRVRAVESLNLAIATRRRVTEGAGDRLAFAGRTLIRDHELNRALISKSVPGSHDAGRPVSHG